MNMENEVVKNKKNKKARLLIVGAVIVIGAIFGVRSYVLGLEALLGHLLANANPRPRRVRVSRASRRTP